MTIKEYWTKVFSTFNNQVTIEKITTFAEKFEIDQNFLKFYELILKNEWNLTIISDGYDTYISSIFNKYKLNDLNVFSNKIKKEENKLCPEFQYTSESCNCETALCKRNVMLKNLADDDISIYVGDGNSDKCVSRHCDVIFAKGKLEKWLSKEKVPHYHFNNFFDVIRILNNVIQNNKLKSRNEAYNLRLNAFKYE